MSEDNQEGIPTQEEKLQKEPIEKTCKVVLIGNETIGKTSLALFYKNGKAPTGEIPIIAPNFQKDEIIENNKCHIVLWDSACGFDDKDIRMKSYHDTDLFILAFALNDHDSLIDLIKIWHNEIEDYNIDNRVAIVGLKSDERTLTVSEAQFVTNNIPHRLYAECSSKTGNGVDEFFKGVAAVLLDMDGHPPKTTEQAVEPSTNGAQGPGNSACCLLI